MTNRWLFALTLTLALAAPLAAQRVYVSGLENPTKLIAIPNGALLVTQTGAAPNFIELHPVLSIERR